MKPVEDPHLIERKRQSQAEAQAEVDRLGDEFVERFVLRLATTVCQARDGRMLPLCLHPDAGLAGMWENARSAWQARPLDHCRVNAVGQRIPRYRDPTKRRSVTDE